jgi:hypothetical protein
MERLQRSQRRKLLKSDDIYQDFCQLDLKNKEIFLNLVASQLIIRNKWHDLGKIVDEYFSIDQPFNKEQSIIVIQYLLHIDKYDESIIVLKNTRNFRKRHVELILSYCLENQIWEIFVWLLHEYYLDFELNDRDLVMVMKTPNNIVQQILPYFHNKNILFPYVPDQYYYHHYSCLPLTRIGLTHAKKNSIIRNLPINIKPIKTKKYKVVIDGANVLYCGQKGLVTPKSYQQLDYLVHKYNDSDIIIVLHKKYLNIKKNKWDHDSTTMVKSIISSWKSANNIQVYETPYGVNDDYHIIYLSLKYDLQIISNDKFRDHIFIFNDLKNWFSDMVISYDTKTFKLNHPHRFSVRHQSDKKNFYIPTTNRNFWMVHKKI